MFVDKVKIKIKAGDGGDGAISFHKEKHVVTGGPDGGDGGRGGDIIFQVDDNFSTLINFHYKRKYVADRGKNGASNNCTGKSAMPLIIKVPRGTLIRDATTGRIMADMSTDKPKILARGGMGGKGNYNFATATRQIPRFAKPGYIGEEFDIILELKLLADVGLVGFPNVGKSTLISVVSAAKPKIANYHFTTLTPVLGVVKVDNKNSFVMADIPGLIEGAGDGIGLGHEFLRHVERCRLIIHVVDVSGIEGRNPQDDFRIINEELAKFNVKLAKRSKFVVANKSDIATKEQIVNFKNFIEDQGIPFCCISAAKIQGIHELVKKIIEVLDTLPPIMKYEVELQDKFDNKKICGRNKFEVTVKNGIYYIAAPWIRPFINTIVPDDYSSLQYFQRVLINNGIIAKLDEMGIQEGDIVNLEGFEFDFIY